MKNFIDFWAAPDWRLLGFIAGAFVVVVLGVYWWCKVAAKNKEEKKKKNATTLGFEQINQLFKIRFKMPEDDVLLSSDPTKEYPSGTGDPTWFKLDNVPKELSFVGSVIKVTKGLDGKIKIVAVRYDMLPTEKETLPLREARVAAAKAKAEALKLEKAKKAT